MDAETGGQKSAQKTANACRDRKAGTIPANIPAETAYLEFAWKPVVRSDWMMEVASERLGHSKVGITLDLYSHVMPGMQDDAAARVDDALRVAQKNRTKTD